jgi:hypothetical protein
MVTRLLCVGTRLYPLEPVGIRWYPVGTPFVMGWYPVGARWSPIVMRLLCVGARWSPTEPVCYALEPVGTPFEPVDFPLKTRWGPMVMRLKGIVLRNSRILESVRAYFMELKNLFDYNIVADVMCHVACTLATRSSVQ